MDWILPDLAIGNYEDVMNTRLLETSGVAAILSLTTFPNLSWSPFRWIRAPLIDGAGNTDDEILEALDALADLHSNHPPVIVHCAEGKSRSVLVVSLYLARERGVSLQEMFDMVRERRTCADIDDYLWGTGIHIGKKLSLPTGVTPPFE